MTERSSLPAAAGAAAAVIAGYVTVSTIIARVSPKMLPWVLGRGFGIAAYLVLAALTAVGLWLRHPWRLRRALPSAASSHHAHSLLSAVFLALTGAHIVALTADKFAGVGLAGVFVPGASGYRPLAVALGTISLYLGLAVAGTAALAGWVGGKVWLPIHQVAAAVFALVWMHGLLAGSDTAALRPMYLATGAVVVGLAVTRRLAAPPESMMVTTASADGGTR